MHALTSAPLAAQNLITSMPPMLKPPAAIFVRSGLKPPIVSCAFTQASAAPR